MAKFKKMVSIFPARKVTTKKTIYGNLSPENVKNAGNVTSKAKTSELKGFGKTWYDTVRGKTKMVKLSGSGFPGKYKLSYKKKKK